jgi:hypothetical protein
MDATKPFWDFFNNEAAPKLARRENTFRKIFQYLDALEGPIIIAETGCVRLAGNWSGDGQSTILFDQYISARDADSACYTVDINPDSVNECRKLVSNRVIVNQDDSVHFLADLVKILRDFDRCFSLVYLDSFDLDHIYWQPSAIHHLKELVAIQACVNEQTLVVVDDCPLTAIILPNSDGDFEIHGDLSIGGKGRLIAEYAGTVGAKLEFSEYQAGWTGFNRF